ncbi:hypothetical protein Q9295_10180 [Xinfangfangia sp. CPCC 101601]|uniref:DUF1013 domain-containing protein n=1 Tax=Pseudogemmobacter lacusdianii TaxID=3069608 RepID=A0ABU0VZW9_9RHOB|nr:hypothetical protein [Xinfangfangia sp. CPCC 101601]MDQ2066745.1 hypothetical protein [Xinfangfangia sp. CPCC 101601]
MTVFTPEMCVTTGRLLTEWFEHPEYTDEQLEKMACDHYGIAVEDRPMGMPFRIREEDPEKADLAQKINAFIAARRRRTWPNGMTKQEVQFRLNEATKMIDPTNFKFLPDDVRERTGLEINPLWMMEALVRSGLLTPKEQVAALKELAAYTHSKAPNISHSTTTHLKPEDWLLELAKDEYKVLGKDIPMPQPMQPVERGMHVEFEKRQAKRLAEKSALAGYGAAEVDEMTDGIEDAEWDVDNG